MPWTSYEFKKKHNKSISDRSAGKAASIANAILAESGDEGKAIRIANASVRAAIPRKLQKLKDKRKRLL